MVIIQFHKSLYTKVNKPSPDVENPRIIIQSIK